MLVLAAALMLLALGRLLRLPGRRVALLLGVLWAAIVAAHLLLPPDHPLPRALGGSLPGWAALGVAGVLGLLYRAGLARLRARARSAPPPAQGTFSAAELDRYARHIVLREIGGTGQKRLKRARVLVIGAGGLGSPALLYLAAAGVGTLGVVDDDTVSNSNLQRQILHRDADIGRPKVASAAAALRALNPFIEIRPHQLRLGAQEVAALVADHDLVLDGSDNFATRYLLNAACVAARRPLLSGAITQWEGQLSLYNAGPDCPCYACIFPEAPAPGLAPPCAEAGVVGALPGVIGAMMAGEAIKHITGAGRSLAGRLILHDALWGESREIALRRRPDCAVCGTAASGLAPAAAAP